MPGEIAQADFVVVGGGSGGCAAARILAERAGGTVAVLEAGGTNDRPDVADPDSWHKLLNSDVSWDHQTIPQRHAAGRVHRWPMGRVLGGSSSVNGMKYMRGAPWDYQRWVGLGNPGWEPDAVYEVYRALEDYPNGDQSFHGTGGPIGLTQVVGEHPLTVAFLEACDRLGFRRSPDFNSFDAEGYGLNQLNTKNGRRQDAGTALLGTPGAIKNLTVILNATAQRLVCGKSGRVTAVQYATQDGPAQISVGQEVILAAGAISSPHLLMLSGIGPAEDLERAGISVRLSLAGVGQNLHDHIGVPLVYDSLQPIPPSRYQSTEVSLYRRGTAESQHFDTQITMHLFPAYLPPEYVSGPHGYTYFPGLLKPRSRGSITVRSADPDVPPVIDPAYLSDERDVEMLADIVQVTRELAGSQPFEKWRGREVGPGDSVRSREELRAYVRAVASTYFHPVGTCRMGSDALAVTDHRLKVRGTANLRVADTSVMPEIVSGNTNAPAMMIGWRAAEFALADAGQGVAGTHAG